MINHSHFPCQKLGGKIGPLYDAGSHDLILVLQIEPELKSLNIPWGIKHDRLAVLCHQVLAVLAVLQAETGKGPLCGTGVQCKSYAIAVIIGQLLSVLHNLIPGCRRLLRIKAHFLEGILIIEHDHGASLERNGINLAVHIGILHESRKEIIDIFLAVRIRGNQVIQRHGHPGGSHGKTLGCQTYEHLRGSASLYSCLQLGHCIVIVAGIDRLYYDIRILCIKIITQILDQLRCGSAYIDRIVKGQMKSLFAVASGIRALCFRLCLLSPSCCLSRRCPTAATAAQSNNRSQQAGCC